MVLTGQSRLNIGEAMDVGLKLDLSVDTVYGAYKMRSSDYTREGRGFTL
jgi:hypothetical protein